MVIVRDNLTEVEAYEIEAAFITAIGRDCDGGPLVNLSEGGKGGALGVKHDEPFCQKRRAHMLRFYEENPEARQEVSRRSKGNRYNVNTPRTPEWNNKISDSLRGNNRTLGYNLTEGHKAKIGDGVRGTRQSPDWIAKRIAKTTETKAIKKHLAMLDWILAA